MLSLGVAFSPQGNMLCRKHRSPGSWVDWLDLSKIAIEVVGQI